MTWTISAEQVWTPRTIYVARKVVEAVVDAAKKAVETVSPEWLHMRTALMMVLNEFPAAKDAVMDMFAKLCELEEKPEWAT